MSYPELHADIELHSEDISDLWKRFEIFEALHHTMTIDNPMSSSDLDRVVSMLAPVPGEQLLDLACGHGELLRRMTEGADIRATGVDLSPWMIRTAHRLSNDSRVRFVVADAKHFGEHESFDIVTCLGATWIWHGSFGTVRALADRVRPGGRVAMGDMHLRDGLSPAAVKSTHGAVDNAVAIEAHFARAGLEFVDRIATSDASWDDYLARTRAAVTSWAEQHPGEAADRYVAEQLEWEAAHARDREILTWSVFIGCKPH